MTDYTNAPPSRSALFDNVPTRKTSADYTSAVAVWPSGRTQRCNVKVALPLEPDAARVALVERAAVVVFVRSEQDAERVRDSGGT